MVEGKDKTRRQHSLCKPPRQSETPQISRNAEVNDVGVKCRSTLDRDQNKNVIHISAGNTLMLVARGCIELCTYLFFGMFFNVREVITHEMQGVGLFLSRSRSSPMSTVQNSD